jgi:spore germination protein YaaH
MRMHKSFFVAAAFVLVLLPAVADARSLSQGMTGSDVTALQQALVAKGYLTATPNGRFGPATLAAVKKFQCDQNIVCSGSSHGIYGPRTQAALAGAGSGGSTGGPSTTPGKSASFEFSGWLPYWSEASSTRDALAHIDQLTEINPFVYVVQNDGTIQDMGGIADEPWLSLLTIAKAKKIRVIPTVMWSNRDAMHRIISNQASRIALVDEIVALAKREGFDGIDIDFEGKQAEDREYYTLFHKGLYQKMGKLWVMCTIESRTPLEDRYWGTTIPADAGMYANDFVAMNQYCDRVRFMTYDQQTIDMKRGAEAEAAGKLYGPVADTAWVEKAIREAMKVIPKHKIAMGIATYGYEWDVTAYADGYVYDLLWSFGPNYATPIAAQYGITPERQFSGELGFSYVPADRSSVIPNSNNVASAALAQAQSNNSNHSFRYMTWQDSVAIKDKVDLARRLGIRGVAAFRIDGGSPGFWEVFK